MLATHTPTGARSWPHLLVEGLDDAGVLPTALALARSDIWGARYVIEVSDRAQWADAIGGPYLIVEHDGTLPKIVQAIYDVQAEPPVDGKPTLLVVAGGSPMWRLILQRIDARARAAAPSGAHPDTKNPVAGHVWDEIQQPFWWDWIIGSRRWPGVLVVTAGAKVTDTGAYQVDAVGGTPHALTATVRCTAGQPPAIVAINTAPDPLDAAIELPGGLVDAVRLLAGDLLDTPITVAPPVVRDEPVEEPDDLPADAPETAAEAPFPISDPLAYADLDVLRVALADRKPTSNWAALIAEASGGRTVDEYELDDDELADLRTALVAHLEPKEIT